MATYGFLFWATTNHGTPGANDSVVINTDAYPTTYGNGATAGYVADQPNQINETNDIDYRLIGTHYIVNNTVVYDFRVDVTGSLTINSSNGDHGNSGGYTYSEFFDNTTSLGVVVDSASGQSSNQFWDASGVKRTSASDWVTNQTSVSKTVSTFFKWRNGKISAAGSTYWNYIQVAPSSSDVTVALTGVVGTSAVGSVVNSDTDLLSSVAATGSVGSVTPSVALAITGNAATGALGTVAPTNTLAITGNTATSAAGTVTQSITIGLTGVSSTGAVGDVGVAGDKTIAITGVAATGQVGSVAASNGALQNSGGYLWLGAYDDRKKKKKEKLPKVVDQIQEEARHQDIDFKPLLAQRLQKALDIQTIKNDSEESQKRAILKKQVEKVAIEFDDKLSKHRNKTEQLDAIQQEIDLVEQQHIALQAEIQRLADEDEEEAIMLLLMN